jgi:SEC-C motif-containing protein
MTMIEPLAPTAHEPTLEERYGAYLRGDQTPETAAELMGARYAAYALHDVDFVLNSQHPEKREDADRKGTERWSREAEWLGFEVLRTEQGGADDSQGVVEFLARYRLKGVTFSHRERAEFKKHEGRWYFWEGQQIAGPPVVRKQASIGRNDPCSCGSGKKYKKCCGKAA